MLLLAMAKISICLWQRRLGKYSCRAEGNCQEGISYIFWAEERGQGGVGGWQRKRGIGRRLSVQQREVAKEKENTQ